MNDYNSIFQGKKMKSMGCGKLFDINKNKMPQIPEKRGISICGKYVNKCA